MDMQQMYEKKMKLLQRSMKRGQACKRRRVEMEGEGERDRNEEETSKEKKRAVEADWREKISELNEELELERNKGIYAIGGKELRETTNNEEEGGREERVLSLFFVSFSCSRAEGCVYDTRDPGHQTQ